MLSDQLDDVINQLDNSEYVLCVRLVKYASAACPLAAYWAFDQRTHVRFDEGIGLGRQPAPGRHHATDTDAIHIHAPDAGSPHRARIPAALRRGQQPAPRGAACGARNGHAGGLDRGHSLPLDPLRARPSAAIPVGPRLDGDRAAYVCRSHKSHAPMGRAAAPDPSVAPRGATGAIVRRRPQAMTHIVVPTPPS